MLDYVKGLPPKDWDQAEEILQGGFDRSDYDSDACGRVRLGAALMELTALQRQWQGALDTSDALLSAESAVPEACAPEFHAVLQLRGMACLALGKGAKEAESPLQQGQNAGQGADACAAHLGALCALADPATELQGGTGGMQGEAAAPLAVLGQCHRALALLSRGQAGGAKEALAACATESATHQSPLLFDDHWQAAARIEQAIAGSQIAAAGKDWKGAEDAVGTAMAALEGAALKRDWEMSLPLVLTGMIYARSGRVMFAEGLLREAAKRLHLSIDDEHTTAHPDGHVSCAAAAAWTLAQLYKALPKRESEAQRWHDLAMRLWPYASCIREQLGTPDALTGSGNRGRLHAMSFVLARVFEGATPRD